MQDEETGTGEDGLPRIERPLRPWGGGDIVLPGADHPAARVPQLTASVGPDLLPGLRSDAPVRTSEPLPQPFSLHLAQSMTGTMLPAYARHPAHVDAHASGGVRWSGAAAFVLGILSFLIPWFGLVSCAAVIVGLWSRASNRVGRGRSGDGFAVAGLILGVTSLVFHLVVFRGATLLFPFR